MPGPASPIVIIGGGMAGGNAAATLRDEGFRGPVVLVYREPGVPFGRPPLSKTYLRSEEDLTGWYVRPASWYADHDVELRTGTGVRSVDPAAHTVTLDSGEQLGYQQILIATGGSNRRLSLPGADLPGIHYLRTVAECDAIKREAVPGRRAAVVGMSFIGCEVAASLTQLGVQVTAVFPGQYPLDRVLGDQVGDVMGAIHREKGVELLPGGQVTAFEGAGRVDTVVTASGRRIACDFVVAGVGIRPEIPEIAVAQDNGILTDELCRASAPDVYAAGDVAEHPPPAVRPGPGGALQQRGEAGRRGGQVHAWLYRPVRLPVHVLVRSVRAQDRVRRLRHQVGRRSWSAAAWRTASWSASTWWTGWCGPRSAWTVAVTLSWTTTARWRPPPGWWPGRPGRPRPCSRTSAPICGR